MLHHLQGASSAVEMKKRESKCITLDEKTRRVKRNHLMWFKSLIWICTNFATPPPPSIISSCMSAGLSTSSSAAIKTGKNSARQLKLGKTWLGNLNVEKLDQTIKTGKKLANKYLTTLLTNALVTSSEESLKTQMHKNCKNNKWNVYQWHVWAMMTTM